MKYKIEIWQWRKLVETYESDDIKDILLWYRTEGWSGAWDDGLCSFNVYEGERQLSFDEAYELGFYD